MVLNAWMASIDVPTAAVAANGTLAGAVLVAVYGISVLCLFGLAVDSWLRGNRSWRH